MDTLNFKGYQYNIKEISSKAEFDRIYDKLLGKANKGGSITADLEYAYRIAGREVYLIRYDEQRRALIPVRVARERVDGKLMRNRYDSKHRAIQQGIGQELSRQGEQAGQLRDEQQRRMQREAEIAEKKRQQEKQKLFVHGGNCREQIIYLAVAGKELQADLQKYDLKYRENRDYQLTVRKHLDHLEDAADKLKKELDEVDRDPTHFLKTVQHLIPPDLQNNFMDNGFLRMLEYWTFFSAFLSDAEKEWVSLKDYALDVSDLPVNVGKRLEDVFGILANAKYFCNALDKLMYPEKIGAGRESGIYYDIKKVSWEVVKIFNHI